MQHRISQNCFIFKKQVSLICCTASQRLRGSLLERRSPGPIKNARTLTLCACSTRSLALYFRQKFFQSRPVCLVFRKQVSELVPKLFFPGLYPPSSDSTSRNLAPTISWKYLRQKKTRNPLLERASQR